MPPERNNTVRFTQLSALPLAGPNDIIPIVDTSIPTLVNKKITISGLNQSLPVGVDASYLKAASSSWDSVYASFNSNSAEYESTFSNIISNSSNWDSAYTSLYQNSAAWSGLTTYTTVNENSAGWESVESTVNANSASWIGGNSAYISFNSLSAGYWILKSGDQMTGALTTTKTLSTQFTNSDEFVSKRYADALALQAQVSGNFLPALYYTKTESDDRFFNQGETNLLVQNVSAFTGNNINIYSNTLILSSPNNASNSPLFRMPRFNAGLYFDAERCLIRGDHWGDGDAGFIELRNQVTIGRSLTDPGLHVNVTNPKVFILGNNTESGIGFSPTTNYVNSDTYLMREVPYTLALRTGTNQHALRIYNTYTNSTNFERLSLSATKITYENAGTGTSRGYDIEKARLINFPFYSDFTPTVDGCSMMNANGQIVFSEASFGTGSRTAAIGSFASFKGVVLASNSNFSFANNTAIAGGNFPNVDISFYRDGVGDLAQRASTTPQIHRIYNTYTNANNYERLSLSATRIAYEYAGTGVSRDLTIVSTGNLVLSAGGVVNISSGIPTSFSSLTSSNLAIANDGRIYNAFASPAAHNIQFSSNNFFFTGNNVRTLSIAENIAPGNGGIWMRSDRIVGWSSSGDPGNSGDLRLKRIGASSLALDSGGTANTPSFTVYGNISGSGSVQTLSSFIVEQNSSTNEITPELTGMWLVRNTARHGIASTYQGVAISMLGFYYNNVGIGGIQENGGFIVPSGAGFGWSNSSAGLLTYPYARIGFFREGDFNIGLRPFNDAPSRSGFSDASLKIYKMFADTSNYERLALSGNRIAYEFAGTGVSRDLTIQSTGNIVLSAGGVVNIGQSLPIMYNTLSARDLEVGPETGAAQFSGVLRIRQAPGSFGTPGLLVTQNRNPQPTSIGGDVALATFGGGGYNNLGMSFTSNLLAQRILASPNPPQVTATGSWQAEGLTDLALKVAGKVGFTVSTLDASNMVRPVSATMEYNWSNNLISLSSSAGKVGFRFEPVEAGNNRPEIYSDGNLYITNNFGGGRRIYFNGSQNQLWNPFELGYNGAFAYGTIEITATQQPGTYTFPYFKITQDAKQLSNLVQIVSSNGSTILSYSSAGVLNLNSRIFLKPDGLIQFTNTSSTTPAIKGTATTVQARTGDDSQYTYLQGKLQTDQAASAGTFTPDKYIILYDSTGTAYKVPVQAL